MRSDFPPETVIVWGVFYTALLILAYSPTYIALLHAGRKFTKYKSSDSSKTQEEQHLNQTLLPMNWTQLQSVFSLFSPLIGSVIPVLMGTGF